MIAVAHHDVGRFEIPVDDPVFVSPGDAVRELEGDLEKPPRRQMPPGNELIERVALQELHRQITGGLRLTRNHRVADLVDHHDVGVIQGRGGARLVLEAAYALRICGTVLAKDLERDVAPEASVPRPVDLAHASAAERRDYSVGAESQPWRQNHADLGPTG